MKHAIDAYYRLQSPFEDTPRTERAQDFEKALKDLSGDTSLKTALVQSKDALIHEYFYALISKITEEAFNNLEHEREDKTILNDDLMAQTNDGSNLLHLLALKSDQQEKVTKIFEFLSKTLNSQEKVKLMTQQSNNGNTPLHNTAIANNLYMAKKISSNPIMPERLRDEQNNVGETALYIASVEGRRDIVAILLENEADPCIAAQSGLTPLLASLMYLKDEESLQVVELLINNPRIGECIEDKDPEGNTVLHLLVSFGLPELIGPLLKTLKSNKRLELPTLRNASGQTAFELAESLLEQSQGEEKTKREQVIAVLLKKHPEHN